LGHIIIVFGHFFEGRREDIRTNRHGKCGAGGGEITTPYDFLACVACANRCHGHVTSWTCRFFRIRWVARMYLSVPLNFRD